MPTVRADKNGIFALASLISLQPGNTILWATQRNDTLAQLPIGIPDAIPRRVWRRKKTNGLANAAGLTSAEIAKRDLAAKGKAERAAIVAAQKQTPENLRHVRRLPQSDGPR